MLLLGLLGLDWGVLIYKVLLTVVQNRGGERMKASLTNSKNVLVFFSFGSNLYQREIVRAQTIMEATEIYLKQLKFKIMYEY